MIQARAPMKRDGARAGMADRAEDLVVLVAQLKHLQI